MFILEGGQDVLRHGLTAQESEYSIAAYVKSH